MREVSTRRQILVTTLRVTPEVAMSPELNAVANRADGLEMVRGFAGNVAPRDAQELMAYPFFSLSKSRRLRPIEYRSAKLWVRVEGSTEHGLATIWDADVLIWIVSQLVEARDAGLPTSRLICATPYEILTFIGRGTSVRDYERLKAALDRLQSTSVATSIRQLSARRAHRFSWINEWKEHATATGRPLGLQLIIPDWLYDGIVNAGLVLTIDASYFQLTGGIERWLYRTVRKHGGRQTGGWSFDLRHLYRKSGSAARFSDFAGDVRRVVRRQSLPGYRLTLLKTEEDGECLTFAAVPYAAL